MAAKSNFLAVAFNSQTNTTVTAGSLSIPAVTKALTNDSIANATVVDPAAAEGAGFTDQVNTATATPLENSDGSQKNAPSNPADPVLPAACYSGGSGSQAPFRTVWYSFSPTADGTVTIDTANSRYDTVLAVFTGSPGSLTLVNGACADDSTEQR